MRQMSTAETLAVKIMYNLKDNHRSQNIYTFKHVHNLACALFISPTS